MPLTVTIIDDDERFRSIAAALVRARGLELVGCAADAATGLDEVARLRPDGVLIDYHLPDDNGLSLARRLSRLDRPPVIVLTSAGLDEVTRAEMDRADIRAFVPKDRLAAADLPRLFASAERGRASKTATD
ncbi:response regulator [Leifsonia sp. NPDC058230]|uniref:response regulator n=1 Tax=Leifsonia sp. NPDC058230 TaxID=3346391 RepID=UPI0036DB626A